MLEFTEPWCLLLLLAVPPLVWWWCRRSQRGLPTVTRQLEIVELVTIHEAPATNGKK